MILSIDGSNLFLYSNALSNYRNIENAGSVKSNSEPEVPKSTIDDRSSESNITGDQHLLTAYTAFKMAEQVTNGPKHSKEIQRSQQKQGWALGG